MRLGLVFPFCLSSVFSRRITLALASVLLTAPAALHAQATAPAVGLGSVNVGATASSTVTFAFSASTTVTSVYVLSQGATNGEFVRNTTTPGTCSVQMYASGSTCTVGVQLTPTAPGTRVGAVTLATSSGPQAGGYAAIYGTGMGGRLALLPGTETAITNATTGGNTFQMASDQAGNVYYGDYTNGQLYKDAISGTTATQTTIASGLGNIGGIALDGAGDIFVATVGTQLVYEFPYLPASGTYGSSITVRSCTTNCWAVAIDPVGSLFVAEGGNVYKGLANGAGTFGSFQAVVTGLGYVLGLAVDAADTLYIADRDAGKVYIDTTTNGTSYVSHLIDSGHSNLNGMAFDASGLVYASDTYLAGIQKYTPNGSGGYTKSLIGTIGSNGVTVTPGGVVYANNNANQVYVIDQTQTASSTSSSLNATSPVQTVMAYNSGNAAFTVTSLTTAAPFSVASSNGCTAGSTVASAGTCALAYQFSPTSSTTPQPGTLTLATSGGSGTANLTGNVSGSATKVLFYTPPATPIVAGGNPGTVQAVLEDTSSNYVTTPGVSVSLSSNYGGTTSYAAATTVANGGFATFATTSPALTVAGTYSYTAASSGLTSATASEVVTPGPATQLSATPASTSVYVGQALAITVKALDQYGNVATSDTDTVSLAATPSTATPSGNFALASSSGAGNVTFTAIGTYTVKAQDVSNSAVTSGTTATITVLPLPVFTVTTLLDDATGTAANCTNQAATGATPDVACALRDAIVAANAVGFTGNTGSQTTVNFAPALYNGSTIPVATCTVSSITPAGSSTAVTTSAPCIVLSASTASMAMSANVNLAGPGPTLLAVSGNSAHTILNTGQGSLNLTISGLTLTLGSSSTSGGALYNGYGTTAITLLNDVFYKNTASTNGGAMYDNTSGNTLAITNSTFDSNTVTSSSSAVYGGALYLGYVTYTIAGSNFSNNNATSNSTAANYPYGGAVYATSCPASTIRTSSFIGNLASGTGNLAYGGALYSTAGSGNDTFTNTVWIGNTARGGVTSGYGGAMFYVTKGITLIDSLLQGNAATTSSSGNYGQGGAIYSLTAKYLYNTTVTGNFAKGYDGGILSVLYAYNSIVEGNSALVSNPDATNLTGNSGAGTYLVNISNSLSANPLLTAPSNTGSFAGPVAGAGAYAAALMTVIPLPGSPALGIGTTSTTACSNYPSGFATTTNCLAGQTTDLRGLQRISDANATKYVDAGATQSNYTAAFGFQPSNALVSQTITGNTSTGTNNASPTVQLYESGQPFIFGYFGTLPSFLTVSASAGTLAGSTAPAADTIGTPTGQSSTGSNLNSTTAAITYGSGATSLAGLSLSPAETNDTLLASLCVGTCAGTKQNLIVPSNSFNVGNAIVFTTTPPATAKVGSIGNFAVQELNANGSNHSSSDSINVTITYNGSPYLTVSSSNNTGGASGGVGLQNAGTYVFTITDPSYTSQTLVATTIVSNTTLGSLTVTGFPSADHNGVAHNVTVTAYDTTGAVFTGYTGTVTLTSNDALATLPSAYTFTASDAGVHVSSVTLATGGKRTITATDATSIISGSETGIIVDDFIWVLSNAGATTKLDETGAQIATTSTATTTSTYGGIAFDSAGNAWSVSSGTNALLLTTKADAAPTSFSGTGGLNAPVAVAIDGAGLVWVANSGNSSVSEFTNAGVAKSASSGYASTVLASPSGIAIDNAGGVWVSNKTGNTLVHIFGGASPVVTPQAKAVANATVGMTP